MSVIGLHYFYYICVEHDDKDHGTGLDHGNPNESKDDNVHNDDVYESKIEYAVVDDNDRDETMTG